MFSIFADFASFLGSRKKFWLLPIIVMVALMGALFALTEASAIAPFIYAVF